ncbi:MULTISPECIES: hypothetical protein [unclassified Streptomyces]|uniref:hypothetical protein n=1 Tax=unclassified Streptomyces TaxID=2593676 RepID=UPI003369FE8E
MTDAVEESTGTAEPDGANGGVFTPWSIDRGKCVPRLDVSVFQLATLQANESVYSRQLVKFPDASLPASVTFSSEPDHPGPSLAGGSDWTRAAAIPGEGTALVRLPPTTGGGVPEPGPISPGPGPAPNPPRPPGAPPAPGFPPPPPPKVFTWDLFLMLRYRQDIVLDGYGVGDLALSVSLMPNEELTLEVKTWETSRVQQDQEDQTEQRNSSDIKNTSSISSEVTNRSESKEHESVDAKAGYGGFGFSASVETNWSQDVDTMQNAIAKQTQDRSQQTAQEHRSSHKVRVSVSREEGRESKTTRRIRNVNQAHTLTASYYEIIQQFKHTLNLYDASLLLLGAEVELSTVLPYANVDPGKTLTLGYLIRYSRSEDWISSFIDLNGFSPIKVLRQAWAKPLYDGALVDGDFLNPGTRITSEQREQFRSTLLRFVRPSPGWIEPDEAGALRWGYEIYPERESEALEFLYSFLPNSAQQLVALAEANGTDRSSAYTAVAYRYAQAVQPSYVRIPPHQLRAAALSTGDSAPPSVAQNTAILIPGPFLNKTIHGQGSGSLQDAASALVQDITNNLAAVRDNIGQKGDPWPTIVPTHGLYADLALGACSGAEDYIEVQRQLDLERRQLENERLRLENQLIANGQAVPTITVDNRTERGSVNVEVETSATPPARIELRDQP